MQTEEKQPKSKNKFKSKFILAIIVTLILGFGINQYVANERKKMYPGDVQDELFYKYFKLIDKKTYNAGIANRTVETYEYNETALYRDLGINLQLSEFNNKYKDSGVNMLLCSSCNKTTIETGGTLVSPKALELVYNSIYSAKAILEEKAINPDELMTLESIKKGKISTIMPTLELYDPNNYKKRPLASSIYDVINKVDYKKEIAEDEKLFRIKVSIDKKETNQEFRDADSTTDNNSYKKTPEYLEAHDNLEKELEETYGKIFQKQQPFDIYKEEPKFIVSFIAPFKLESSNEKKKTVINYSDPNYQGI